MSYYLWAYPGPAQFDHDSPGDYVWSTGTNVLNASVAGVQTYAAEHDRIFFIKAPLINGTHSGSDIVAWLTQHYTLAGEYASTAGQSNPLTVTIQLYVKKPVGP